MKSEQPAPPLKFPVHIPFVEQLGFELHHMGQGEAELRVDLNEGHLNSWRVAHGGLLMTLLDVAMAHAARSPDTPDAPPLPGVVTIEMKTAFMRPGEGRMVATGRRLHRTASMAFCEAFVHDTAGRLLCHASGTFKYMKGLPAGGGRRIQRLNASD